jgi:pimeloyl-ACP methyl ester carboxylesterase
MSETHSVPVGDDETVVAEHHAGGGDRWLVFCHGFLSDKSGSYEARCERAVEEGYDAVRFDFRGSGDSDRPFVETTLSTRLTDLRTVVDYFDPSSYALFGSSFGGKVALHAAVDDRVEAVATRAPVTYNRAFDDYRAAVADSGVLRIDDDHAVDERFFEDFERHPFADVSDALGVPVAMFHGSSDTSVPITDTFEAAAALDTDVMISKFAGEGHRFSAAAERRLLDHLFAWLPGQ